MQFVYPPLSIDTTGLATEATLLQVEANTANTVTELQTANTALGTLATEATASNSLNELQDVNSELNAQTIVLNSIDSKLTTPVAVTGPLTDTELRASAVPVSATSLPLPTGAATEATLSSVDTKTPALVSGRVPVDGSAVTQPISAASLPLPTGAATEATLADIKTAADALNARTAGSLVPEEFDEQVITYVLAGPGAGEVFQIVYKLATVTVRTVTISYDGSNRVSGVVAS